MHRKSRLKNLFVIMLFLSLTACANFKKIESQDETKKAPVGGNLILIREFSFDPQVIIIHQGEQVTWENMDKVAHTIVFQSVESKKLDYLEEFKYIFREPGTYSFTCGIHKAAIGKIIVE